MKKKQKKQQTNNKQAPKNKYIISILYIEKHTA
jgi:hypothetical protein